MRTRYYAISARRTTRTSLYPLIGRLEKAAGLTRADVAEEKLTKLEALLDRSNAQPEETGCITELLSIPNGARYARHGLSSQKRKEKTSAALLTQIEQLARRQPVM
jgi:predicted ATPase